MYSYYFTTITSECADNERVGVCDVLSISEGGQYAILSSYLPDSAHECKQIYYFFTIITYTPRVTRPMVLCDVVWCCFARAAHASRSFFTFLTLSRGASVWCTDNYRPFVTPALPPVQGVFPRVSAAVVAVDDAFFFFRIDFLSDAFRRTSR